MTRLVRALAGVLLVFVVSGGALAEQRKPAGCDSVMPWTGTWKIWGADGISFGTMHVYRQGDRVHGTYTGAVYPTFRILGGWFEGRVLADGTVAGRWYDDGPEASKKYTGQFRWLPRGKVTRFDGRWKTDLEMAFRREWYGRRTGKAPCGGREQTTS